MLERAGSNEKKGEEGTKDSSLKSVTHFVTSNTFWSL